ncbi:hypothetical protein D918_05756 [Trichuris suis]|nr:hypothetical protein D918_05756 [Trichuris suis]
MRPALTDYILGDNVLQLSVSAHGKVQCSPSIEHLDMLSCFWVVKVPQSNEYCSTQEEIA